MKNHIMPDFHGSHIKFEEEVHRYYLYNITEERVLCASDRMWEIQDCMQYHLRCNPRMRFVLEDTTLCTKQIL